MFRRTAAVLAASLGMALCLPAAAQWKWLDAKRQVQYSDLPPPPGVPEQDILQRPAGAQRQVQAAAPAASAASTPPLLKPKTAEPELEARRRKAEQDEAASKKAAEDKQAGARADNCNRAKEQMRTIDSGLRIARTDAKGERYILDDAGRAAEARRAQDVIGSDCR